MNVNTAEREPESVEALLPWHAAGTLSARETRRVEEALSRDPALARQYAVIRDELTETIHLNEDLGAPSARAMQKLFAAIDAEPARKPARSFNLSAKLTEFLANLTPRALAYSASAAAVVVLLQAGIIGTVLMNDNTGGSFETASYRSIQMGRDAYAVVRFSPDAKASEISDLLTRYNAAIVDGPKAGMFRIRIGSLTPSKDETAQLMARLGAEKVVSFVAAAE